jgi:hypothetical protein
LGYDLSPANNLGREHVADDQQSHAGKRIIQRKASVWI